MSRPWALAVVAAAVMATALGVGIVLREDNDDRQAVIDEEIAGVWRAGGIPDQDVQTLGYDVTRRPGNSRCQGLPEDDHWFASRTSRATAGRGGEQRLAEAVARWLDEQGYATHVYDTPYGNYLVDGVADDRGLTVTLTVSRGGAAHLRVGLTPCTAGPYEPPDPGVWTPVED